MKWVEVSLEVDGEAAEAVADVLNRYGHQGVAIEQVGFSIDTWEDEVPRPDRLIVRAYWADDERAPDSQRQLEEALGYLNRLYPMPTPKYRIIDEEDWAEAWKANYHPVRLGRHLLIRPLWIEDVRARPDDVIIALDPGMAFGTGTHPSTQLVLEAAEDRLVLMPGADVLDLGSGSGILAIAAAKLGAAHILAVDTDPIAVRTTAENAEANGVAALIDSQPGSLDMLLEEGRAFDLALVNILAKVIIALCEAGLGKVVRPGGIAIFGGIIDEQAADVEAALRATGLIPFNRRQSADWVVVEARKEH